MSDWYARKLAELRGAPPVAPAPSYPPTAPGQLPPHLAPYAAPVHQPGLGYQGPHGTPQAPPPPPPQAFTSYDANTGAVVQDDGTIAALVAAAQAGGTQQVKQGSTTCPNCGGGNYFTVSEGGVFSRSANARVHAMQCADCNYPQVQAGSHGGALQGARSGGPAKAARQLPEGHRVTVIGEGGRPQTFEPATRRS